MVVDKQLSIGEPSPGSIYGDEERKAILEELEKFYSWNLHDYKDKISEFENAFSKYIGCNYSIAINGGGTALDLILKALDCKPTDEIVSPAINFHGTHSAIINTGAKLILCDSTNNLNICIDSLKRKLSPRTKAVVITHMNGLGCDENEILKELNDYSLKTGKQIKLISDSARSCGSAVNGIKTGNLSWATFFSFQRKKQMNTLGEGGMVTTNDLDLAEKIKAYRSFGMGKIWGSNFKMTNIQAAIGIEQLKMLDFNNSLRRNLAEKRTEILSKVFPDWILPVNNNKYFNSYYLYSIILPNYMSKDDRDNIMNVLYDKYGVGSCIANNVTYKTNNFIKQNASFDGLENSERIADRLFCVIIHPNLTEEQEIYITDSLIKVGKLYV
ncbi:DegT/DnrJ/EryC1/StrS family aminotransferase [Bacillus cereus]|uniref:DegT/DnrJ/EryC1/StrS family aminotransferase n=1 Tax=Bacillus cereus TaxID=1396 RepID=UPI00211D9B8D|nr:aminotransferase class I/II-fold pyridoxal phosphate-dependent enzyme [Bacillus cereus]